MKVFYFVLLSFLFLQVAAQEKSSNSMTIGTNIGGFDHSSGFGPVFFVEYDWCVNQFLKLSPHLQMGSGNNTSEYGNMGEDETVDKLTNSFESGLLLKIVPIPKYFDRLRFITGFTYLIENTLISDTGNLQKNGFLKQSGFNTVVGLDLDVLKLKKLSVGLNYRVNTSNKRILLYHFGIVTTIKLAD